MTRRGLLLFAAMCVIWGIPYLLIRVAVRELEPVTLGFSRTMIAALVLLPIAAMRGDLRPLASRWLPILVFAVIEIVIPWFFLARAETELTSSLTGLLIAAVPLVGAVVTTLTGERERHGARRWAGLCVGMVSVSVLALGMICTALAFVVFFKLIAEIGPVRATVITYVNPAVAAVLGVTILSEHLTFGMGLGFALVLAGSVLATAARRERAPAPSEAPSAS